MGKLREIWQIVKRQDFKDGDEVHAVQFNGGLMLSNKLYKELQTEIEDTPDTKYLGDLYGVNILSTPHLPYIYKKVKKTTHNKPKSTEKTL